MQPRQFAMIPLAEVSSLLIHEPPVHKSLSDHQPQSSVTLGSIAKIFPRVAGLGRGGDMGGCTSRISYDSHGEEPMRPFWSNDTVSL